MIKQRRVHYAVRILTGGAFGTTACDRFRRVLRMDISADWGDVTCDRCLSKEALAIEPGHTGCIHTNDGTFCGWCISI